VRYRILEEIGVGGMGRVHLACIDGPGGFQKWIAIKRIHPHLVEDDTVVQMFLDEGRVAARISHPNVATVLDLGRDDEGEYFIALEYLHGEPLSDVVRVAATQQVALPLDVACRIIADAAEGLHAAHELTGPHGEALGLVHRDVTPHNLFVTYEGVTKVVDFGIAKFRSRASTTSNHALRGKLAYMSPEQLAGEALDRRSDVFSLGVVAWEITTGQRLFRATTDADTSANVYICDVPRPTSFIPGYPAELEEVILTALARDRSARYPTARHFARALQIMLMRQRSLVTRDDVASCLRGLLSDRIEQRDARLQSLDTAGSEASSSVLTTLTEPTAITHRYHCHYA
jgi:serine/threonine protein kinase